MGYSEGSSRSRSFGGTGSGAAQGEKRVPGEGALWPSEGVHRFLLAEQLAHLEYLEEVLGRVSVEIEERLGPFEEELALLESIPGVGRRTAEVLLAE